MSSYTRSDVPSIGTGPEVGTLIAYDANAGTWYRLGTAGDDHIVVVAAPPECANDDDAIQDWLTSPAGDAAVRFAMPGYVLVEFARRPGLVRVTDVDPAIARALAASHAEAAHRQGSVA